eukprot:g2544.t1
MEDLVAALSGGVGKAVSKTALYPLDMIKVKMQSAKSDVSSLSVVREIAGSQDGIVGLYRGLGPKLVKSVSQKFIYFYLYSYLTTMFLMQRRAKKKLENQVKISSSNQENSTEKTSRTEKPQLTVFQNLSVGYLSELLGLPLIIPLENIVTRVQTAKPGESISPIAILVEMLSSPSELWQVYTGTLDAYMIGCCQPAIQFLIYDKLKLFVKRILQKNQKRSHRVMPTDKKEGEEEKEQKATDVELGWIELFVLGAISKGIAQCFTFPIERARVIVQTTKKGNIFSVISKTFTDEGFFKLFQGLEADLAQGVFGAALMLMIKEKLQTHTKAILSKLLLGK